MNGFGETGCLVLLVLSSITCVLIFSYLYYLQFKRKVFTVVKGDVDQMLSNIDYLMHIKGWETAVYPRDGMITVFKNPAVGVDIILEKMGDGSVSLAHAPHRDFWNMFIIIVFYRYLGQRRLGEINHFATHEVIPIIMYSYHGPQPLYPMPSAGHPSNIEKPSFVCPTCSQPGRYVSAYQRWYCDYCERYM